MESFESLKNVGDQGLERLETVAFRHQNDHRNRQRFQVLLEFDVLVGGENRLEFSGRLLEERTVAQASPAHLRDGSNVVAHEEIRQWPGERFIEQESHETSAGPWQLQAPRPLALA